MSPYSDPGFGMVAQIASSADPSMLQQIVAAVANVTGSRSAYIERHDAVTGDVEVVASCGPDAPPPGSLSLGLTDTRNALTFPLYIDAQQIGAIVCVGAPRSVALDPADPGRIELLGTLAASALRNVSLLQEVERATTDAIERRFRLLNGLVHYLKNTLGAAGEYVQLVETDSELTSRQQGYISASQRNIDVALRLLTELVDLGRVETGRLSVTVEPIDPNAVLRGIVRDYELSNGTSGIHFELELATVLPRIDTDVDLMRRILDTLLSNAAKYTSPGGRVSVSGSVRAGRRTNDPSEFVCICVHDDGPGVAEREQVFEEVVRAESTNTAPGFRLAISRRIARLLGGDLSLDACDNGSSFSLWLPIRAQHAMATTAVPSPLLADEHTSLERPNAYYGTALAER
jgi:signal transduction histidine kinase